MNEINGAALLSPTSNVRDQNRQRILREVMIKPATQVRLAQLTSLSPATVSTTVKELEREGILQVETEERARRVRLGQVRGAAVGIDVGYSHVTVLVRPLTSTHTSPATFDIRAEQGPRAWIGQVAGFVRAELENVGLGIKDVVAIGLGAPGGIDPQTGVQTQAPLSFGWDSEPSPDALLSEELDLTIAADNDANMGALGEYLYGAGQDSETFVYVKVASGVGAGLVIGGNLLRGRRGIAMELGHMTVDPSGVVCGCGKRGCLETMIGANYLIDQARQAKVGYRGQVPTSLDGLIERARAGDRICRRIIDDAGRRLGFGLAQMCVLLDPDLIAIGGQLSSAFDLMQGAMTRTFRSHTLPSQAEPPRGPQIVKTERHSEAQVLGALTLGLRSNRPAQRT
jgi:predicted NBD/HSP70 family sugar kinase